MAFTEKQTKMRKTKMISFQMVNLK